MVEWRPIPGTSAYFVSDSGAVRKSITNEPSSGSVVRQRSDGRGYLQCDILLCEDIAGKRKRVTRKVHILVMESFHGPTPNGFHIDHDNHNKADNRLENLRWRESRCNSADCRRGSRAGVFVLSDVQKQAIVYLSNYGMWNTKAIASAFGKGETTIRRVLKQRTERINALVGSKDL